jgi:hypothetical protein
VPATGGAVTDRSPSAPDQYPRTRCFVDRAPTHTALPAGDRITHVNPICCYLGDGTSETAINNIVANNFELTDNLLYDRWPLVQIMRLVSCSEGGLRPKNEPARAQGAGVSVGAFFDEVMRGNT